MLTIIEGPPGTGKTTVLATIAAHWMKMYPEIASSISKILICAPSNAAAENIAERLNKMKGLKGKFVRAVTEKLENIIHVDIEKLPEYTLLYKMFNYISTGNKHLIKL